MIRRYRKITATKRDVKDYYFLWIIVGMKEKLQVWPDEKAAFHREVALYIWQSASSVVPIHAMKNSIMLLYYNISCNQTRKKGDQHQTRKKIATTREKRREKNKKGSGDRLFFYNNEFRICTFYLKYFDVFRDLLWICSV
jgi:hypothetical protein